MFLSYLISFIFGLIIGSFLNVLILRYNTGKSLAGRSGCLSCGKQLTWKELVPVLSFLWQKGRCRGCKSRISLQYPLVELLTGFVFALVYWRFEANLFQVFFYFLVSSVLIFTLVYDFRHKIIPNTSVYLFIALGIAALFFPLLQGVSLLSFVYLSFHSLVGAVVAGGIFFLIWLISRGKWLGFGDVKLALGIGLFLGTASGLSAIILSVWIGALVGLFLILFSRLKLFSWQQCFTIKSEIPFAPFLIIGFLLILFFNFDVLSLYAIY